MRWVCLFALAGACAAPALAQSENQWNDLRVLLVNAHPDDEVAVAGTVYQITHKLGGIVDLAIVTDGSGGFRFSTLAEPVYGLELTDETVARQHLPAIRKREVMAGGAITGIRDYFFLDEYDDQPISDVDTVLSSVWDTTYVGGRLAQIVERGLYDFVIGLLPIAETQGHHQAATILAIDAAQTLPIDRRPVVLGGYPCQHSGEHAMVFEGLPGFPQTRVSGGLPLANFDLLQEFGLNDRLDFRIVTNWVLAEHKSQGLMSLLMNSIERECYWYFDLNEPDGRRRTVQLFDALVVRGN